MNRADRRRRVRPPKIARVSAAASKCSHCPATGRITRRLDDGSWQVTLSHDPDCPRVIGNAGSDRAMVTGAFAAAREYHRRHGNGPVELSATDPEEKP